MEVFVLDPERLPFAGLSTVLTGDRSSSSLLLLLLLQRAVDSLLLKHCGKQKNKVTSVLEHTEYIDDTHRQIHGLARVLNN